MQKEGTLEHESQGVLLGGREGGAARVRAGGRVGRQWEGEAGWS